MPHAIMGPPASWRRPRFAVGATSFRWSLRHVAVQGWKNRREGDKQGRASCWRRIRSRCGRQRSYVHAGVSHQSGGLVSARIGRVTREVHMSSFFSSGWCRRGAFSAAALVALALANPASAQPKTPAKPAPRPAPPAPAPVPAPPPAQPAQNQPAQGGAPAAAAEAGQVQQLKPEPAQPDWLKFCGNDPSTNQQICYTPRDFVSDQGQPALAVAIYDLNGKPEKIARFILPLGLLLTPGIRFSVDQSGAAEGKFVVCLPNGCFAEGQTTEAFINGMKKGTSLNVKFRNQGGEVT